MVAARCAYRFYHCCGRRRVWIDYGAVYHRAVSDHCGANPAAADARARSFYSTCRHGSGVYFWCSGFY